MAAGTLHAIRPGADREGDFDGDGRFQRVEWVGAGDDGVPTTLLLFVGASDLVSESYEVRIEVPGEGAIGMFAGSLPDLIDGVGELLTGDRPALTWDQGNRPVGTRYRISTRYLDGRSRIIDEETISTSRAAE